MKGVIDRFEEGIAVIEKEDKTFIHISQSTIPIDAKEGDEIDLTTYTIKKRKKSSNRLNRLFNRKNKN